MMSETPLYRGLGSQFNRHGLSLEEQLIDYPSIGIIQPVAKEEKHQK